MKEMIRDHSSFGMMGEKDIEAKRRGKGSWGEGGRKEQSQSQPSCSLARGRASRLTRRFV